MKVDYFCCVLFGVMTSRETQKCIWSAGILEKKKKYADKKKNKIQGEMIINVLICNQRQYGVESCLLDELYVGIIIQIRNYKS